MRIDVFHHIDQMPEGMPEVIARLLAPIAAAIGRVERKLMTFATEATALLGQINTTTSDSAAIIAEVQADQADLLARLAAAPTEEERASILAELTAANARLSAQADVLRGVASAYTPVPVAPTDPIPGAGTPLDPNT